MLPQLYQQGRQPSLTSLAASTLGTVRASGSLLSAAALCVWAGTLPPLHLMCKLAGGLPPLPPLLWVSPAPQVVLHHTALSCPALPPGEKRKGETRDAIFRSSWSTESSSGQKEPQGLRLAPRGQPVACRSPTRQPCLKQ